MNCTLILETYTLDPEEFQNPFINIREIEKSLQFFNKLSSRKKEKVFDTLNSLPDKVRVAERCSLVTTDFLLIDKNHVKHYIEFHEKQHRNLSVNRETPIFDLEFNRFEIPRYVQRFLKDIWRYENLRNYKIVWFDWFKNNKDCSLEDIINSSTKEHHLNEKFSFTELLKREVTQSTG